MGNNFSKNISDKRKGIFLILMSLVIMVSSFAFMTDNKQNKAKASFGDLALLTSLKSASDLSNLAPGDSLELDLEVLNQGSLDGFIRTTYQVVVPEDKIDNYKLNDVILEVNGNKVVDIVNTPFVYYPEELGAGASLDYALDLILDKGIKNSLQEESFRVEVLTEIKQLNSTEWDELRTETVQFGHDGGYGVVPSNNILRSSAFNVMRVSVADFATTGYVTTTLNSARSFTVSEYKRLFLNESGFLNIYTKDGVLLGDDERVVPGSIIKLESLGRTLDQLQIILKGDATLDGGVTRADERRLKEYVDYIDTGHNFKNHVDYSIELELSLDLDDDGLLTRNDYLLLKRSLAIGSEVELPDNYPIKPTLKNKPSLGLKMTDNSHINSDSSLAGDYNELRRGATVYPGQVFEVGMEVKTLRTLKLLSLNGVIEFNNDYLELLDFEDIDDMVRIEPNPYTGEGIFPEKAPGRGYWIDAASRDIEGQAHIYGHTDTILKDLDMSPLQLGDSGDYALLSFRVKDDVPLGTRLDFRLKGVNFVHVSYGGLTFYDTLDSSLTSYLIVGEEIIDHPVQPTPGGRYSFKWTDRYKRGFTFVRFL